MSTTRRSRAVRPVGGLTGRRPGPEGALTQMAHRQKLAQSLALLRCAVRPRRADLSARDEREPLCCAVRPRRRADPPLDSRSGRARSASVPLGRGNRNPPPARAHASAPSSALFKKRSPPCRLAPSPPSPHFSPRWRNEDRGGMRRASVRTFRAHTRAHTPGLSPSPGPSHRLAIRPGPVRSPGPRVPPTASAPRSSLHGPSAPARMRPDNSDAVSTLLIVHTPPARLGSALWRPPIPVQRITRVQSLARPPRRACRP